MMNLLKKKKKKMKKNDMRCATVKYVSILRVWL